MPTPFEQHPLVTGDIEIENGRRKVVVAGRKQNYARVLYEALHGPIGNPKLVVHHKDGDALNDDPFNLELMDSREHLLHHGRVGMSGASRAQAAKTRAKTKARKERELKIWRELYW